LFGLLQLVLIGGVLFWLALVWWTVHSLTHPPRRGYAWAVARQRPGDPGELDLHPGPPAFEEWIFESGGVEMAVWDIVGQKHDGPVVILTPGWGQGRVGCLDRAEGLLASTSRLILWEMPAMGDSAGRCTLGAQEPALLSELVDRVRTAKSADGSEQQSASRPLVLAGVSMGAGVSIVVAATRSDIAGVIAEAPYRMPLTPARGVLKAANLPRWLNLGPAIGLVGLRNGFGAHWRCFDRADYAAKVNCPLLVLHGSLDQVSPLADGLAISQAAPQGELVEVQGADHHNLWQLPQTRQASVQACARFLDGLL
jgi:pimeloyl-ACP methyl ester carboxylesterase